MHRIELCALRSIDISWERLVAVLPQALEALGLAHDEAATDGEVTLQDRGGEGRLVVFMNAALARRAALAVATRAGAPVALFEVIGTSGGKRVRFRTAAFKATAAGELRDAEGKELDLEDPAQTWGGGDLSKQAQRVLEEFAVLVGGAARTVRLGYRKRPAARPSTPRVATLLASLMKAKSHQGVPQAGGRVELRIELAAGGKQTSYCSAAEYEELQKLIGGAK
jgi:hypothetical protein